jgi:glycosyltransferase involved in cell wall biosynthesis
MSVALLSDRECVSIFNEAEKISRVLSAEGFSVKYERYDRPRSISDKYDAALWVVPLLACYFQHLFVWRIADKVGKQVIYTVTEGVHHRLRPFIDEINKATVITPSKFAERACNHQGVHVDDVIPHQMPEELPIDHEYGKRWRSSLPPSKKVLIYNGSQVLRKGLWKLKEAVDILSKKRSDFVMVFHTDNIENPWHTPTKALKGVNTVVETDFGRLDISKVYAKMAYADVVVHPAMCEGFGLPVAEALTLGKPLICINAPAVNEIASPQNSWMVTEVHPCALEWPYWMTFFAVDYDSRHLAEQIELCLDAKREEIEEKKAKGFEAVKRLHNSYKRLLKWIA